MADPTVQVPVSLIERAERRVRAASFIGLADELSALLSQPNPTADFRPDWMPEYVASLLRQKERSDRVLDYLQQQTGSVVTVVESILAGSFDGRDLPIQPDEPPRPEDMAPATTCGMDVAGTVPSWAGEDQINPSTIRDVTPPAGA